jgi:hypothetical protein
MWRSAFPCIWVQPEFNSKWAVTHLCRIFSRWRVPYFCPFPFPFPFFHFRFLSSSQSCILVEVHNYVTTIFNEVTYTVRRRCETYGVRVPFRPFCPSSNPGVGKSYRVTKKIPWEVDKIYPAAGETIPRTVSLCVIFEGRWNLPLKYCVLSEFWLKCFWLSFKFWLVEFWLKIFWEWSR